MDVIAAAGCLHEAVCADPKLLATDLWPLGQVQDAADITLGVTILTAAAQLLRQGQWNPDLLPVTSWPEIFPHLLPAAMEKAVMDWVFRACPVQSRALAEEYLTPVLRDYEQEMRPFSADNPPDPRFVKLLLFKES